MRVLILGGNGFIGSHLVDEAGRHGHQVRVFDRHPERYREPLNGVEYVVGDFGSRADVSEALNGIDLVFHLVGTTLPQTSNEDPAFDVEANVIRAIALLEECVAKGVQKVVYVSSGGTVYGIPGVLPVREDSPTSPISSYGITRLFVEKYLELFRRLRGLEYAVVRPSNAYGPRQNPCAAQGIVSVFLGRILEGRGITIWGDGSVVRDYVYVQDLVEGIYAAAVPPSTHRVFNLGSGAGVSVNELVELIARQVGSDVKVEYEAGRAFDVPAIYLDVSRAAEELGWRPTTSLSDGIARTLEFLRQAEPADAR